MLNNPKTLFSGGLGKVDMKPINIKLKKGCKPHASRHYSVPKMFERPFRKEVERLVRADILERLVSDIDSPWAAPFFVNPKRICQLDF